MRQTRVRQLVTPLTLAFVLLSGCDRMPTATEAEASAPAFDFVNGPEAPGPFVVRIDGQPVLFFTADVERNLMSIHFPLNIFLCGGGAPRNLAGAQFVITPSEAQRIIALLKDGDGAVAVYGTSDFTEAFGPGGPFSDIPHMCAFMNGDKKLAEGTVRRVSVFTSSSFSGQWTGTLTDAQGDPVRYAEHHAFVIDQETGAHTVVTSTINLH